MGNEQSSDGKSDKNIKNERSSDDEKDNTAIEQSRIGMKVVGSLIENKRNGRTGETIQLGAEIGGDINKIQQIIFV
ncbi:unnamed protein product [Rhizophagus irregularis]|nr:unnamed protein product [Rhizophagus irregularis]